MVKLYIDNQNVSHAALIRIFRIGLIKIKNKKEFSTAHESFNGTHVQKG